MKRLIAFLLVFCWAEIAAAQNQAPTISEIANQSAQVGVAVTLHVTINDDNFTGLGALFYTWSVTPETGTTVVPKSYQYGPPFAPFVGPQAYDFIITASTAGNYVLSLQVGDFDLTTARAFTLTATGDPIPPPVTCPVSSVTGGLIILEAAAMDPVVEGQPTSGMNYVQWSLDDISLGPQLTQSPYHFDWDSRTTGNGMHTIRARAYDKANNVGMACKVFNLNNEVTPVITVTSTDAVASEEGLATGSITFTRTGPATSVLVVKYTVSGSATNGIDYSSLNGSVTIDAGQMSATVLITPVDDSEIEANENVILTLADDTAYSIGGPNWASVDITSNDAIDTTPPNVTITQPMAGSTVSGFVPVAVVATDPSTVKLTELFINGKFRTSSPTGSLKYSYNSNPDKRLKQAAISARATDGAGNVSQPTTINVAIR